MNNFDIGKTIRDLRIEHQYSQVKLGELLKITDSAISKWESGDSNPNIEQLNSIAILFGMSIDQLLNYQEQKNTEQLKLELAEKEKQSEKNRRVKEQLKEEVFRKIWDKEKGLCNEARIITDYDGTTLTLYQKDNPNIVLYDSYIGSGVRVPGTCAALRKGKWEQCPFVENRTDTWRILFDFNNPIERIRFSFDEPGIEDYEFSIKYVPANKQEYYKKIKEEKRAELLKNTNIQVLRGTIDIPGNYGSSTSFTGIVNVIFNPATDDFSYGTIELYSFNSITKDYNFLRTYRLKQGERIWMEDKICGQYHFILKQYDSNDNLIVQSDFIKI